MMKTNFSYINYELLPEYTENSQLSDLFIEHKSLDSRPS